MKIPISAIILTRDCEKKIIPCLDSLAEFVEVVVLDNGSTDATMAISSRYPNVKLVEHAFIGFGPLRNLAVSKASCDWILAVDSDEVVTPKLLAEIKDLKLNKNVVYSMPRLNHYNGRTIKCCGWYPDRVARLFHRGMTGYSDALVHESINMSAGLKQVKLHNHLKHFPFDTVDDLINKMQKYSTLYAKQHRGQIKSTPVKAVIRALYCFFTNYFIRKGFAYGYEGLLISVCNANGVFYKYVKLYEENKKCRYL